MLVLLLVPYKTSKTYLLSFLPARLGSLLAITLVILAYQHQAHTSTSTRAHNSRAQAAAFHASCAIDLGNQ